MKSVKTHEDLLSERIKNKDFWTEYWRQEPFFYVARELRNTRRDLGMSQEVLANRSETHQSRISRLESAELDFRLSTLIKVAEALDTHVDIRILPNRDYTAVELTNQFLVHMTTEIGAPGVQGFADTSKSRFVSTTVPT